MVARQPRGAEPAGMQLRDAKTPLRVSVDMATGWRRHDGELTMGSSRRGRPAAALRAQTVRHGLGEVLCARARSGLARYTRRNRGGRSGPSVTNRSIAGAAGLNTSGANSTFGTASTWCSNAAATQHVEQALHLCLFAWASLTGRALAFVTAESTAMGCACACRRCTSRVARMGRCCVVRSSSCATATCRCV